MEEFAWETYVWEGITLWHIFSKPVLRNQKRRPLIGNGSANTPVATQWLSESHVTTAKFTYASIEEILEAVFSVRFVPRLQNEDQFPSLVVVTSTFRLHNVQPTSSLMREVMFLTLWSIRMSGYQRSLFWTF
jgi:hypothetical protein